MIDATHIRKGMIIIMDGTLYRVMEMQLITPGRWKAMVQTKLRNIQNGSQTEHRFRSEERLEQAHFDEVEMEFLYEQGGEHIFMNLENYEQVGLSAEAMGDAVKYLKPNTVIEVELFDGKPVGVNLPNAMDLKVTSTEPRLQGATQDVPLQARGPRDRRGRPGARVHQGRGRHPRRHARRQVPRAGEDAQLGPRLSNPAGRPRRSRSCRGPAR